MTALEKLITEADEGEQTELRYAKRFNRVFYGFAAGGFVVGIAAGVAAVLDSVITAGVCGVLAGAAAGLQSLIMPRERAALHYENSADLGELENLGTILAERSEPPSQDDLKDLAARIAEVKKHRFQRTAPNAVGAAPRT